MKVTTRRLLEEQIAVVVVLESGKKNDAMWHVPQILHWEAPGHRRVFFFAKRNISILLYIVLQI